MPKRQIEGFDAEDKEARKKLGVELSEMLESGILQKGNINTRARVNEAFYRNEPDKQGLKITEESEPYHLNLVQPRVDAIVTKVCNPILSNRPYYAAIAFGEDASRNKQCEDTVQFFLENTRYQKKLREATRIACLASPAIYRVIYIPPGHHEQFGLLPGPHIDVIHPNDFVLYPLVMGGLESARMMAHRLSGGMRVREIKEKQKDESFFPGDVIGGDDPQSWQSGRDREWSGTSESDGTQDAEDRVVEVWEGLIKLDLNKDGFQEWYRFTLSRNDKLLLDLAPYGVQYEDGSFVQFSRPWYFEHYVKPPMYGEFFCANSPAQDLQPLQGYFNDFMTLAMEGCKMTALPTVFQKGGSLSQKVIKYGAGEIHEVPAGTEFEILNVRFDPSILPFVIQMLMTLADSSVRISQAGLAGPQQSVKSDRATATEVTVQAQNMDEGADEYRDNASMSGEKMCDFIRELVYLHAWELSEFYDVSLPVEGFDALASPIRWEAVGKTMQSVPQVTIQQLQTLMQMAPMLVNLAMTDPGGTITGLLPKGIVRETLQKMHLTVPLEMIFQDGPPDPIAIQNLLAQQSGKVSPGASATNGEASAPAIPGLGPG